MICKRACFHYLAPFLFHLRSFLYSVSMPDISTLLFHGSVVGIANLYVGAFPMLRCSWLLHWIQLWGLCIHQSLFITLPIPIAMLWPQIPRQIHAQSHRVRQPLLIQSHVCIWNFHSVWYLHCCWSRLGAGHSQFAISICRLWRKGCPWKMKNEADFFLKVRVLPVRKGQTCYSMLYWSAKKCRESLQTAVNEQ